ncbi:hypothetical protein [Mycolicibacterium phocaicum]|uniref:Uncharacterized protein n=1 Tax=Mycolicibacterium phocaicum TaxID=319706 RepID=A0A7I7ZRW9_9MYCO|nr:hypothetical protein [Mycolicibacterium phocaicum]TLH73699.1 hypothetical protein C1S79_03660 [Mycolicibacterium phocaicum]BBZ55894.1 hypothetical protein MPHO_28860 [Mycolicibacterium phocaicum]
MFSKRTPRAQRAAGLIVGLVATATAFAGTAGADQTEVDREILVNGQKFVCGFFDTQGVSSATVNQIGKYYINKGYTPQDAGTIVYKSVQNGCSKYLPAVRVSAEPSNSASSGLSPKVQRYINENREGVCSILTANPDDPEMLGILGAGAETYGLTPDERVRAILMIARDNCPSVYQHWQQTRQLPTA